MNKQNLDEFYETLVRYYNYYHYYNNIKRMYVFQLFFLLRLFCECKNSCKYKEYFKTTYENILNCTISDLPHLKNVIKLLKKYDFTKDIKCNEEINSIMDTIAPNKNQEIYFGDIDIYNLYKLILNDKSKGFETINNSYFKVSLELLLALLLDLDTQDDENITKVRNRLQELGISDIE